MSYKTPETAIPMPVHYGFGPFVLSPTARTLTRAGTPVRLGGRAFDLLVALVSSAGQVVSKKDLLGRVWPDVVVEEGSLRFHMVAVRKALSDGSAETHYIKNVAARGYSFVAPVSSISLQTDESETRRGAERGTAPSRRAMPPSGSAPVGRQEAISDVVEALQRRALVTIAGPGGIGKTTVALASGHRMAAQYAGDISFVDLSLVLDPAMVGPAVAAGLGMTLHAGGAIDGVASQMRGRAMLLILDGCEHVIDAVAALVQEITREPSELRILATSREALDVEGEYVYRLAPLDYPRAGEQVDASSALQYSSIRLFVDRAAANGTGFELTDADAPLVAKLCRELDGIALAIELAAGRLEAHGLHQMAELIDKRIKLIWHGRRTAVPRHQTMRATLDWSHNLLTDVERIVLRRLAVFVGGFTLDAATAVVAMADLPTIDVIDAIASLTTKSLLNIDAGEDALRYVLLDTTRAYALSKLADSGEQADVSLAHAKYYKAELGTPLVFRSDTVRRSRVADLGNFRSALDWCLVLQNDPELGCALAAALTPLLLEMAMLAECRRWTDLALQSLSAGQRGTRCELDLQAALAQTLMFTGGNSLDASAAFQRALDIARSSNDLHHQLRLLSGISIFRHRSGDFRKALEVAEEAERVALVMRDPGARAMADSMLGVALHLMGRNTEAAQRWDVAIAIGGRPNRLNVTAWYGFDHHMRALCGRARLLWLGGSSKAAVRSAQETIAEAEALRHPPTLCIALIWAGAVFFWRRDAERALELVERLSAEAAKHSLAAYLALADGLRGQALIQLGRHAEGIALLRASMPSLEDSRYGMLETVLLNVLAEGLGLTGAWEEAMAMSDAALECADRRGDLGHLPEAFLVRGRLLASSADGRLQETRACLERCIRYAQQQGTPAWELRGRILLADVLLRGGDKEAVQAVWTDWSWPAGCDFDAADISAADAHLSWLGLPTGTWRSQEGSL